MKVTTPGLVRFSYANLFVPKAAPGSSALKYSVALLIPKSDTATVKVFNDAIAAAKKEGIEKFGSKWKPTKGLTLRDGDTDPGREGDATYAGHYFINANANADKKPFVVDKNVAPILDATEFYSGCYGKASVNLFPYDTVSQGIGCGLNGVQKIKEGEPLGATVRAEDEFVTEADDDINNMM